MTTQPKKLSPPAMRRTVYGLAILALLNLLPILVVSGLPKDFRAQEGILGTDAALMSDLSLLAYVLLLVPMMLAGAAFAVNKKFVPQHQMMMTSIVLFNWALISFIMAVSYNFIRPDVPDRISESFYWLPTVHLAFGLSAQVLGTYLVIRMWFEDVLPKSLMVKNIKFYMRLTLAGWLIAAFLGVATYVTWYGSASSGGTVDPATTPEATEDATQTPRPTRTSPTPAATEEATRTPRPTRTPRLVTTPETSDPYGAPAATPIATEEATQTPRPTRTPRPSPTPIPPAGTEEASPTRRP